MFPTSLPGAIPGGITAARPTSPRAASAASVGMDATSSGVRPSRAATGRSAHPSGTHTTYFTGAVWQAALAARQGLAGRGGLDAERQLVRPEGLRPVDERHPVALDGGVVRRPQEVREPVAGREG